MAFSHENGEGLVTGETIDIQGIAPGKDLYNITAPFMMNGDIFILGREENKLHARDSKVVWVKKKNGAWIVDRSMPSIIGEDPSITEIDGEKVISVVKVNWVEKENEDGTKEFIAENWTTYFYRGKFKQIKKAIKNENSFTFGPRKMKDIRLVDLDGGRIGVFTRPDETKKIGYIELNSLEELNEANLLKAKTIEGIIKDGEWGGVNEVHKLNDGRLGILGHVANATERIEESESGAIVVIKELHYRAVAFIYDPKTGEFYNLHTIATSDDFPAGKAKKPDLDDVIFSGGLKRHGNGKATLYVGLRDKEAASIEIEDPFFT